MFIFIGNLSPDPLRDPIWQFIGIIVTFICSLGSIFISIVIYLKQLGRKEITYSVDSNTPVVTVNPLVNESVINKVEVRFNGKSEKEVYLIVLNIRNSGNVPIHNEDYEKMPITCAFLPGTKILDAKILEPQVDAIKPSLFIDEKSESVRMEPRTLNNKEEIRLRVLLNKIHRDDDIEVFAKIFGGTIRRSGAIRELASKNWLRALDMCRNAAMVVCILVTAITLYDLFGNKNSHPIQDIFIMSIVFIIYIIVVFVMRFIRVFIEQQEKA